MWYTKSGSYTVLERSCSITTPTEIRSEEELARELCRLFQSAHRNGVPIRSTWVCRYDGRPDLEVMVYEIAPSSLKENHT